MPAHSRRRFLAGAAGFSAASLSAALLGGISGCKPRAKVEDGQAAPVELEHPVIDAHIHTNFFDAPTREDAESRSLVFTPAGLRKEMRLAGVKQAISLGYEPDGEEISRTAANPMVRLPEGETDDKVRYVAGINPYMLDDANLQAIDTALAGGRLLGLKLYLGYYPLPPDDPRYLPVYELAGKHRKPVLMHTGDTYSPNAKVRFAHPLPIDDMAVDFRGTTFILCHLGNPWTLDAAELLYKNENVFADLSGLVVGDAEFFTREMGNRGFNDVINRIQEAFAWSEDPTKFLYGSDWPLVPMYHYQQLIAQAIPPEHRRAVFHDNAVRVFGL